MALYDDCGHYLKQLSGHAGDCPLVKGLNETKENYASRIGAVSQRAHESCAREKDYHIICPGKCLKCNPDQATFQPRSRNQELPMKKFISRVLKHTLEKDLTKTSEEHSESKERKHRHAEALHFIIVSLIGRNQRPITNLEDASTELDDPLKKRENHLKFWREKILAREKEYKESCENRSDTRVREREAAFNKGYTALRTQEEQDDVLLEDRAIVYDPKATYCQLLFWIEDQHSARCFSCDGSGNDEVKAMPCGHAIHDSCFSKWWKCPLRNGLKCPICGRSFNVLLWPAFHSRTCSAAATANYVPFLGTDESGSRDRIISKSSE